MSILPEWLKKQFRLRDNFPWGLFFGAQDNYAGKSVTPETAMNLSTVWACVGLISRTIATLPVHVYRKRPDGTRELVNDHPLARLLANPNADLTNVEYWEQAIAQILLWGNSFDEKIRRADGTVIALNPLAPARTVVERENGGLIFRHTNLKGVERVLTEDDVFLIRGCYLGGDLGVSAVRYGRHTFGGALAADETASKLFVNGLRQSGFIKIPGQLTTDEQRQNFINNYIKPLQGSENAGKIGALEAGMEWQAAQMDPVDAELLMTRRFNVEEICRWFGVPPVMIGHSAQGQTMWGSGIEQMNLAFLIHGLRPHLRRVQAAVNKRLVAVRERSTVYIEFSVEGLLQADSTGRAKLYSSMFQNAALTPNEIRALENRPPMEGGDTLFAQSNLAPLELLGEIALKGGGTPAPPAADTGDENEDV